MKIQKQEAGDQEDSPCPALSSHPAPWRQTLTDQHQEAQVHSVYVGAGYLCLRVFTELSPWPLIEAFSLECINIIVYFPFLNFPQVLY